MGPQLKFEVQIPDLKVVKRIQKNKRKRRKRKRGCCAPGMISVCSAYIARTPAQPGKSRRPVGHWDRSVCLHSLLAESDVWVWGRVHELASGRCPGGPTCQRPLLPGFYSLGAAVPVGHDPRAVEPASLRVYVHDSSRPQSPELASKSKTALAPGGSPVHRRREPSPWSSSASPGKDFAVIFGTWDHYSSVPHILVASWCGGTI
jgi:hypothetical protein